MEISISQAKQIIERFSQIEYMVQIFDSKISVDSDEKYSPFSDCYTIDELLKKKNDEDEYVSCIEFLYQGGNLDDDDTIRDYMTKTLGIDKDSFDIDFEIVGGSSWYHMLIR